MKIDKILNNNVVVVKESGGTEKIVMGKGIAYKKRIGDEVLKEQIDKTFILSNSDANNKFQELIVAIPLEHIELGEEIISYAKRELGKSLNDMLYISLVDHIYTSIVRFLEGVTVKNALLWDIRRFYKEEYAIGEYALEVIEKRFKICLPKDEAGFIALHLVNAEMDEENIRDMYQMTRLIQEITNIVKYTFHIEFDEESVYYYRFITHLKFFSQRLIRGKIYKDGETDDLLDVIKLKYKKSYECVDKIAYHIQKKYHHMLSDEEKLYLTIHIERVVHKTVTE